MGTWSKQHISYRDSGDTDTYSFTIPREVEEVETKHGGAPFTAGRSAGGQSKVCQPELVRAGQGHVAA